MEDFPKKARLMEKWEKVRDNAEMADFSFVVVSICKTAVFVCRTH